MSVKTKGSITSSFPISVPSITAQDESRDPVTEDPTLAEGRDANKWSAEVEAISSTLGIGGRGEVHSLAAGPVVTVGSLRYVYQGSVVDYAGVASLALTASTVNYVYLDMADNTAKKSTVSFPATAHIPLAQVNTTTNVITDKRPSDLKNSKDGDHNSLGTIQGGSSTERYHLTSAQHTDLTDGGDCTSHVHDDRYFRENEHLNASAGAGDAGKPIKLNASGKVDSTMLDSASITHNSTASKQGGTTNEYYHLTSAQHTDLTDGGDCTSHVHDGRYYTETELNAGQLDTRYFAESEHLNTSAGSGDAGKPIKLNANGLIDPTMLQWLKHTASASDYAATDGDFIIGITDTSSSKTVTLPAASGRAGKVYIIKDESGGALLNNITVDGNASETIDGATTQAIITNYGVLRIYCDGANWFTF